MPQRVAVVTGGNRGLGREIVRGLARAELLVVLTARSEETALMAARALQAEDGLRVRAMALDVTSASGVEAFGVLLEKDFGRCDVLVNNAGIFPDVWKEGVADPQAGDPHGALRTPPDFMRRAMETNVYGPVLLCQRLVPLMKKNGYGRIVNMSSGLGQLTDFMGEGNNLAYRVSKTALNMVTRTFAAALADGNILVNACCPGWCRTDMGGPAAPRSAAEGAETPVWLATLPDGGPTGRFFRDRREIPW